MAMLRRQPGDGVARQLLAADRHRSARCCSARENYSYTLREGETLSTVAQRALGNPMLFYALARYNNIAVPASVGARARPSRFPAAARRRRRAPRPEPRPTPAAARRAAAGPAAPAPRPRRARAANPAQAARLRGQGLAALNAGAVDRAVALLRQALALDPGNAAIRNDLDRALRIQSTVRSRR